MSEYEITVQNQKGKNAQNIHPMLKKWGHFCCWKFVERAQADKPAKVPYGPKTGAPLDTSKLDGFTSFDEAYNACMQGGYDGIGIRVEGLMVGIDIDHCIDSDGNFSEQAQDVIRIMNNSYTEISPSGTGIRIFCLCSEQFQYDKNHYLMKNAGLGLEVYLGGYTFRYVTVTGNNVNNGDVAERDAELHELLEKYMLRPAPAASSGQAAQYTGDTSAPKDLTPEDKQLIERIKGTEKGARFSSLMDGDMSEYSNDHSSADLALCNTIASFTDDGAQIDRIFRSSKLMREKWDELHGSASYGDTTINKALTSKAQACDTRLTIPQGMKFPPTQQSNPPIQDEAAAEAPPETEKPEQETPEQSMTPEDEEEDEHLDGLAALLDDEAEQEQLNAEKAAKAGSAANAAQQSNPLLNPPPPPQPPNFPVMSAKDLMASSFTAPKFLVDGILPVGLTILAAQPKVGKSWLALLLAICMAQGAPFLEHTVEKCEVLYLALEDSLARLKDRSEKLLQGDPAPDGLLFATEAPLLDDKYGLDKYLKKQMKDNPDIGLIIIDTLQKVRGVAGGKETLYGYDYRELGELKKIADNNDIGLLLIHHLRKQAADRPYDGISGSNGVMGAADTAWVLSEHKRVTKDGQLFSYVTLDIIGRDVEEDEFTVSFDKTSFRWMLDKKSASEYAKEQQENEYECNELTQTVRDVIEDAPGGRWEGTATELLRQGQAANLLLGMSAQKVANELRRISPLLEEKDGIMYRTVATNGTGGKKHILSRVEACDDAETMADTDAAEDTESESTEAKAS